MSTRTLAAALAPGLLLALALQAGEAAAQDVCRGGPYTGATGAQIECVDTSGSTDIVIDPGSVNVARIHGDHRAAGDIIIRIKPGVTITGSGGNSVLASRRGTGDVAIVITGGALTGIASSTSYGSPGTVSVSMSGGALSGRLGAARNGGTGNSYVTVSGDATIRNTGINSYGVFATNNGLGDELSVRMTGGSVETTGSGSHGIFVNASNDNGATAGPAMSVDLEGGSVRTRGSAHGVFFASYRGSRDASFRMTGGSIVTEADDVHSVDFWLRRFATGQTASVRMTGGSIVAEGLGSRGLASLELNLGSFDVMTGAGAMIAAPFAVGMEGLLEVDASPTGRLVFAHGGAVEAREVGVLARAARSSGHTMGAGAQTADDAARTMPMIHVTSSGDVTVGASVSDAFIRNRIAGADGTLSAGEQAVLSAITAGDSGALTTALAALPADDYDAAWKAEAQNLLRKRAASSAAPTGDGPLAQRAGEEILGLSRAGVRAYALSHTGIVDHIRAGDALSTAERTVLEAVLTGDSGGLTTALDGLPPAYTTAWKNTVQRLAATYNAGDVRVDVTGGSITAEGNGVEALYAVPHDDNGTITVTVAEGARVTGGANGVYVRGAGVNSPRDQSVTVNGRVRGGTGAGVRLFGGGRLTVGPKGRVGASSGVGVLADGAGDLTATISGTVEGDVRTGNGELVVVIRDADGAPGRVTGRIEEGGGDGGPEVWFQPSGATRAVRVTEPFGTKGATPAGAFDVGIVAEDGGAVRVESGHAPRARVYEALPSVLLGLNRLPGFRDRMSAPRSAGGAGWARVEASRDKWRAAESTSASRLEYTHRRYGLSAGADFAMDERTLLGGSVHHRRGKAKVKGGGELDVSGRGVGVSGTWGLAGSGAAMAYVDAQAEVTWYEADFRSSLRGGLKTDVSGRGHALGVEVGRRYEAGGMALTSRARLAHSKVSMEDFTDSVGARVSLEDGRSLRGGAGVAWEMNPGGASGSRVFGSLDVEREFSPETKTVVSKTDLKAEAGATWVRLGLSGSHAWGDDGRYSVEGGVSYATNGGGHELGGGVSLNVRF